MGTLVGGEAIKLMWKRHLLAAFLLAFLVLPSCLIPAGDSGEPSGRRAVPPGDHDGSMVVDGMARTFTLHVPPSYDADELMPLLVFLHGGWGTGDTVSVTLGFSELADEEGFLVVYPDGVLRNWNDGRGTGISEEMGIDDVGFVVQLIEELTTDYAVDPQRVYLAGVSNGAILAQRFACERTGLIAAFAAVIGTFPAALEAECAPAAPIPALLIFSDEDPLVPFEGGEIRNERGGEVLSVAETIAVWTRANDCPGPAEVSAVPDVFPADGTRARREIYTGCADDAEVEVYIIEGGGHTWPSGPGGIATFRGLVNRDIDATERIWEFFRTRRR